MIFDNKLNKKIERGKRMKNNLIRSIIVILFVSFAFNTVLLADSGMHTRIIVQFAENRKSSYFSQLRAKHLSYGFPAPVTTGMLTSENIILGIQTRYREIGSLHEATIAKAINDLRGLMVFSYADISEESCETLIRLLNQDPEIQYAEREIIIKGCLVPNDPMYTEQWNMHRIEVEQVWDHTSGSEDIYVALLDSGVDYNHPELMQNCIQGYDFEMMTMILMMIHLIVMVPILQE